MWGAALCRPVLNVIMEKRSKAKIHIYFKCNDPDEADAKAAEFTEFAQRSGYNVGEVIYDSIKSHDYCLNRIIYLLKFGLIEALLLPDYDTLGRNEIMRISNYLEFRRNGVQLVFVKDGKEDSVIDYYIHKIKEYYSLGKEWEIYYGSIKSPECHRMIKGKRPMGYIDVGEGVAAIDESSAAVVRRIFQMYSEGCGVVSIAETISNEEKRTYSRNMIPTTIINRRYKGEDSGVPGSFPAIVPNGIWLMANAKKRQRSFKGKVKHEFILDNVVLADYRNFKLTPAEYNIYGKSHEYGVDIEHRHFSVDADLLDSIVLKAMQQCVATKLDALCKNIIARCHMQRTVFAGKIEAAKEELENLRQQAIQETGSDIECKTFDELRISLQEAQTIVVRAEKEMMLYSQGDNDIVAFFERAKMLSELDALEQRYFINIFVKKVIVDREFISIVMRAQKASAIKVSLPEKFKIKIIPIKNDGRIEDKEKYDAKG